jgi:hypothetical protein
MIYGKYKKGEFYVKSPQEMEKLIKVSENVFNNIEDPAGSLSTITSDRSPDFSKKLYDIMNDVTPQKYAEILKQNLALENVIEAESEDEDDEVLNRHK